MDAWRQITVSFKVSVVHAQGARQFGLRESGAPESMSPVDRDYGEPGLRGSGLWGTWATGCGTMSNMIPGIGTMGSLGSGNRDYGEHGPRGSGLWGAWAPGIGTMGIRSPRAACPLCLIRYLSLNLKM